MLGGWGVDSNDDDDEAVESTKELRVRELHQAQEEATLPCPYCHKQFPRSQFGQKFEEHIRAVKNRACLNFARNSTDPRISKSYIKVSEAGPGSR